MLKASSHPSVLAHRRLGPSTMAMLLGVILLTSLSCASLAKNFTRYLRQRIRTMSVADSELPKTAERPGGMGGATKTNPPPHLKLALLCFGKPSHVTHSAWSLLSGSDMLRTNMFGQNHQLTGLVVLISGGLGASYLEACIHSSYKSKVMRGSGSSLR